MSNYTQKSILRLKTKKNLGGKNVIEEMFFTPPLKIISPLEDDDMAEIMLLAVSAGMMKGDCYDIDIHIGERSSVRLTSQSYEKIHDTQDGFAKKRTSITVNNDAFLDYAPLPVLPFKNSSFQGTTDIYLHQNAKLHYSEIICAGRVAFGELFSFLKFKTRVRIYKEDKLVFFENMCLLPKEEDMQNCCLFDGYTHALSIILCDESIDVQSIQEKIQHSKIQNRSLNVGMSVNNGLIIIRALDNQSERLLDFRHKISLG